MKIIKVRLTPRASKARMIVDNDRYNVYVTPPAQDNMANEAMIELLAEHFGVRRCDVSIIKGHRSREKVLCVRSER